jgi:signal transduction histidine kinase/HPt (histidine-containing phosphotransfer) domain-containing protein
MLKVTLQYKIGFLLFIAILVVLSIAYLSYRSLSSIVSSIHVEAKPDLTLITLKEISLELEKAENSVRIYTLSKNSKQLEPYYRALINIDGKMDTLRENNPHNEILLSGIDTISWLIEEKYLLWRHMIELYNSDNTLGKLESLSNELLMIDIISKNREEQSLLERLFNKSDEELIVDHRELAEKIAAVESEDEQLNQQLRAEELKLAQTNSKLTNRFYALMEDLEKSERLEVENKAVKADELAKKTYWWLVIFLIAVTLLALIVVFIVARYIRKTIASQRALEQSKLEAEQLAKMKEIFTANMSHEIRTPLNAVYGFLEQVDMRSLSDENREKLQVVKTSSQNLLRIVNDVLDFSKLQSGKLLPEKTHYSIRILLGEIMQLFIESAKKNHTSLELNIDPDVSETYYGDSFRIKQAIINLVSNAVKFTKNGFILIDAFEENKQAEGVELVIRISDTGIGISPEKINLIFEDYTQGDVNITQKYGGTGLGLSIVKSILSLYGGTIQVESRLDKGSTFVCRIPQEYGLSSEVSQEKHEFYTIPPGELKNLPVLIADDEEYNRLLLKTILKKWHMPFDEAMDGIDAIEKLKGGRFRLALLDIRMPGIDGLKAARFIRENLKKNKSDLPLIAITAAYSPEECEAYRREGFNEVLQKPFSESELLKIITSLFNLKSDIRKISFPASIKPEKSRGKIDFSELYKISGNDEKFVGEMLETFIKSYHDGLRLIDENLQIKDFRQAAEVAHKICSPCRHLGAMDLYQLTKNLENECKSDAQNNNISKLVDSLKNEFLEIERIIQDKLSRNVLN